MPTIEIETAANPQVLFEFFQTRAIRARMSRQVSVGRLELGPFHMGNRGQLRNAVPTFTFLLTFPIGVSCRAVAAWLCENLQNRAYLSRIAINGIATITTFEAITQCIDTALATQELAVLK